jgi:hypothetical protein
MGFVRYRRYDPTDYKPRLLLLRRHPTILMMFVDLDIPEHIVVYKKWMKLREKIQRRFPPKIGRFLL